MSYQVLARKWRPQTFAEVIGQQHITRTLQNAIVQQRVGHAYLFVGPRGIGKTTTARIFAKALNCEAGIVPDPCCQCQSCREIAAGTALDVIEIDGASHNKVEHIRDLRQNVQYTPSRNRYKIYIIDEIHMLSTSAWNALLKTLEEPPPHVKFLFATTEPHKVLPTILSRCQRFDLKRLSVPQIAGRLTLIAEKEGIAASDRALAAIARAADGGMRDGQSLFDQMIAFCSGRDGAERIEEQDVIDVFGLASSAELHELVKALLRNRPDRMLHVVQNLADGARDLERLYADLTAFVRNLMVCCMCAKPEPLLEISAAEFGELQELCQGLDPSLIQRLLQELITSEAGFRTALNKRVYLEAALARIMVDAHSVQIDEIIARLNELRNRGDVPAAAAPAPAPARTAARTTASDSPPNRDTERQRKTIPEDPPPAAAPPAANADPVPEPPPAAALPATPDPTPDPAPEPPPGKPPLEEPPPEEALDKEPPLADPPPAELEIRETAPPGVAPDTECNPSELWHQLVQEIAKAPEKHQLKLYMQELRPVSYINGTLHAGWDEDVPEEHRQLLNTPGNRDLLNACLGRLLGNPDAKVQIKRWIEDVSDSRERSPTKSSPSLRQQMEQNPFVRKVCDLFQGKIVDVRG